MARIALLGAGFSRNWGGWLAPEVLGELLSRLGQDRDIYSRLRRTRNFEDTLAELQAEARTQQTPDARGRREVFERAVQATFAEMNEIFAAFPGWGLSNDARDSIDAFMARFDAIYTLNQDLLLELHYRNELVAPRRWAGVSYPGMSPPANWHNLLPQDKLTQTWQPSNEFQLNIHSQPIFKLHGSSNWHDPHGNRLMVMGGGKLQAIDQHPVLRRYLDNFAAHLCEGNTKLMAIGYSFSDSHINDLIVDAAERHELKLHLVNPAGLEVFRRYPTNAIQGPNLLNEIPLVGITLRTLREAFSGDKLSQKSLLRFFE
jgi:hypothetical protein